MERITPTEEIELGTKTQEAIKLQEIFEALELELEREPTDDEWCAAAGKINMEAIRQAIEDGVEAKNQLVTSNLRMVQGVVNLYIRNGLGSQYNAADLMQEGIVVRFTHTHFYLFHTHTPFILTHDVTIVNLFIVLSRVCGWMVGIDSSGRKV